jgi:predicted nuclease of predicted toxin-antitoxin system
MPNLKSDEIRLLLDENISPNIAPRLWDAGIDALPVRNRSMSGCSDHRVLQFAQTEHRAVATVDAYDFAKLVMKLVTHDGIIAIPSGGTRDDQYDYIMALATFLRAAPVAMDAVKNRIVSMDDGGQINSRIAHAAPRAVAAVRSATLRPA